MLSPSIFFNATKEPYISRASERHLRSFQVTIGGTKYRGHDVSLGGLSFFMSWGGATFARGQTLTAVIHAVIDGVPEMTHLSLQVASFRLNKETGERTYGCAFQSESGRAFIEMLISGTNPNKKTLIPKHSPQTSSEQPLLAAKLPNVTQLIDLVNQLSADAVNENTSDEAFRINSAISLANMKHYLASNVTSHHRTVSR